MKPTYVIEKFVVNKNNVNGFVIVNKRNTRLTQVKSILGALRLGKHFEAPFVVNRRGNAIRVIDGHHRIEAMKEYFSDLDNKDKTIEVTMAVYKNLTDNEEREVYSVWNVAIRQNTHDFINSYKDTIPMFGRLTTELPCTVYGMQTKLRIKNLTEAWFVSQNKTFTGGVSWTNFEFVSNLQQLGNKEVDEIKETLGIMMDIFNPRGYTDFVALPAFKTSPFTAIFSIIQQNKDRVSISYVKSRMKTALANNSLLLDRFNQGGRKACMQAHAEFLRQLNNSGSKRFV